MALITVRKLYQVGMFGTVGAAAVEFIAHDKDGVVLGQKAISGKLQAGSYNIEIGGATVDNIVARKVNGVTLQWSWK